MAYEQRPGDIVIFQEREKRNEKAPDWKGTMIVPDGVKPGDKLEVAVWHKGGSGTMLAGSVKPPREDFRGRESAGASGSSSMAGNDHSRGREDFAFDDRGDDVPFVSPYSLR